MSQKMELGTLLADIRQRTKSREFAKLSREQKEFELEAYLKNLYQALGGANDPNQEGIQRVIQDEIEELSPRIYHGKDIDYSQGHVRTAFNSFMRGIINDGLLSIPKAIGSMIESESESPENFLYKWAQSAEDAVNEAFKDNPDLVLTGGISRGIGQIAGMIIGGKGTNLVTRATVRAKQASQLMAAAEKATSAGNAAQAADLIKKANALQKSADTGFAVARVYAMSQIGALSYNEARELGIDAGLDPKEAAERAMAYTPVGVGLNLLPMEKIFKMYRITVGKDTVADAMLKTGVRDKFMPIYARKVFSGLARNAELGVIEGATEALESATRYPLVVNDVAPWSEMLLDGGIGAAVGIIIGAPATISGLSSKKRKVTYNQALADLDNLVSVMDGYSDKLTPYQKEVRKLLNNAIENNSVTPSLLKEFFDVEIVYSPEESDQPNRTGTHGQMAQVFNDGSAFLQQAAQKLAQQQAVETQEREEAEDAEDATGQVEQPQTNIAPPVTEIVPPESQNVAPPSAAQNVGSTPANVLQMQNVPAQEPESESPVQPAQPEAQQPESEVRQDDATQQQGIQQGIQETKTDEQEQTQEQTAEITPPTEQAAEQATTEVAETQPAASEQASQVEVTATESPQTETQQSEVAEQTEEPQINPFPEKPKPPTSIAFVEAVNDASQTILDNIPETTLEKFGEEAAKKIVLEAAQEALLMESKQGITAENEQEAYALGEATLDGLIRQQVEEIESRTPVSQPVPPPPNTEQIIEQAKNEQIEEEEQQQVMDTTSLIIERWSNEHAEDLLDAEDVDTVLNIRGMELLYRRLRNVFDSKEALASHIFERSRNLVNTWRKAAEGLTGKTPEELDDMVFDAARNKAKYADMVTTIHALAIKGLEAVRNKTKPSPQGDARNNFEDEGIIYNKVIGVGDGLVVSRQVAQLYVNREIVAAGIVRDGALLYIGQESASEHVPEFLFLLERDKGINVFFPLNDTVSEREADLLQTYVYSERMLIPSRQTILASPGISSRFALTKADTKTDAEFAQKIHGYMRQIRGEGTGTNNPLRSSQLSGKLDAEAEATFDEIQDKLFRSRNNLIKLEDGTIKRFIDLVLEDSPKANAYVSLIIRNAEIDYLRRIAERPQTESIDAEDAPQVADQPILVSDFTKEQESQFIEDIIKENKLTGDKAAALRYMYQSYSRNGTPATLKDINNAGILSKKMTEKEFAALRKNLMDGLSSLYAMPSMPMRAAPVIPSEALTPLEAQTVFTKRYNFSGGATAVLDKIAELSLNPANQIIARTLRDYIGDVKVEAEINEDADYAGTYSNNDVITINFASNTGTQNFERTFLHEAVHAATHKLISKWKSGRRVSARVANSLNKLNRMRQKILRKVINDQQVRARFARVARKDTVRAIREVVPTHYGLTDVEEFIAESLTNPEFQDFLESLDTPTLANKITTMWREFVRTLAEMFGFSESGTLVEVLNNIAVVLNGRVVPMRENKNLPNSILASPNSQKTRVVATPEEVSRFNELTADLQKRENLTPKDIEQWKQANPEAYAELEKMRKAVLKRAGYNKKAYHGSPNKPFWVFDPLRRGERTGANSALLGFFASSERSVAEQYRMTQKEMQNAGYRGLLAFNLEDAEAELMRAEMIEVFSEYDEDAGGYRGKLRAWDKYGAEYTYYADPYDPYNEGNLQTVFDDPEIAEEAAQVEKEREIKIAQEILEEKIKEYEKAAREKLENSTLHTLFLKFENPLVYDYEGGDYKDKSYSDLVKEAIDNGHDGVILENTIDSIDDDTVSDVFVFFKSSQAKLANPLNLEDGKLITPDRWADETSPNILYSMPSDARGASQIVTTEQVRSKFQQMFEQSFGGNNKVVFVEANDGQMPHVNPPKERGEKIEIVYDPEALARDVNSTAQDEQQANERIEKIFQEETMHVKQFEFAAKDQKYASYLRSLGVNARLNPTNVTKQFEAERADHASLNDFQYGAEIVRWAAQKLQDGKTTEETVQSMRDSGILEVLRRFLDYLLSLPINNTLDGQIKREAMRLLDAMNVSASYAQAKNGSIYAENIFKRTSPIEILRAKNLIKTEPFKPYREIANAYLDEIAAAKNADEVETIIAKYRNKYSGDTSERGRNRLMVVNMLSGIIHKQMMQASGNGMDGANIGELFFFDLDAAIQNGIEQSGDPMANASLMTSNAGRVLRLWQEFIKYDPDLFAAYALRNLHKSIAKGLTPTAQNYIRSLITQLSEQQEAQQKIISELTEQIKALEQEIEKLITERGRRENNLERAIKNAEKVRVQSERKQTLPQILMDSLRQTGGKFDVENFAQRLAKRYGVDIETARKMSSRFAENATAKIEAAGKQFVNEVVKNAVAQFKGRMGKSFRARATSQEVKDALLARFNQGKGISPDDVIMITAKLEGINITPEFVKKYQDLHRRFAEVGANGIPAQNLMNQINDLEHGLRGIGALDALFAMRKMMMLFGPRTMFLTGVGTGLAVTLNTTARIAANIAAGKTRWRDVGVILQNMPTLLRNSLIRGVAAYRDNVVMKSDVVEESYVINSLARGVPVESRLLLQGVKESDLFRLFVKHTAGVLSTAGRALSFIDKSLSSIAHDAYLLANATNVNGMTAREFYEKYFSPTTQQMKTLREQAEKELQAGLISRNQLEARVIELQEQLIPEQLLLRARNFAAISAFTESENAITEVMEDGELITKRTHEKMNGVLGYIGSAFNRARQAQSPYIKYPAEFLTPFVTTPINVVNWGMNFTPWGYIRAMNPDGIYKLTPEQVELVRAQATMGTITMVTLLLMALLDDDEEIPTFTVTGNLKSVGDDTKRKQLLDIGLEPYVIKVGPVTVKYNDILPSLAFVGNIVDEYRYGSRDKDSINRVALSLIGGVMNGAWMATDMTMLETVGSLLSDTNNPNFDTEKAGQRLIKSMARATTSFVVPQVLKDVEAWIYSTQPDGAIRSYRETDIAKFILVQIPFVRHWAGTKPHFNMLGETITDARTPWGRVVKVIEEDPLLEFYGSYITKGGRVPIPGNMTQILGQKASDDALYVLQRNTLQYMAKMFRNSDLEKLSKLDYSVQKQIIEQFYEEAKAVAMKQAEIVQAKDLQSR